MWRPRIHLSTALFSMLVAGVMLGVNLLPYYAQFYYVELKDGTKWSDEFVLESNENGKFGHIPHSEYLFHFPGRHEPGTLRYIVGSISRSYGWPYEAAYQIEVNRGDFRNFQWSGKSALYDALIALAILLATALACELLPPGLTRLLKRG